MHNYVAIMAGGVGSRFWPGSRDQKPKQFLDILGTGRSLLQSTFDRFLPIVPKEHIIIVTNSQYRDLVLAQLPEISPSQVLCEPSRNNTAPSVAWTAFHLQAMDPEANFVMAPSDHIILKQDVFLDKISKAFEFTAKENALVTLGIMPTRPDTGYGYINFDSASGSEIMKVNKFEEKPDRATAEKYVASGSYLWNAGIFVWKASTIIDCFRRFEPELFNMFEQSKALLNTPAEDAFIKENYPKTPNISIDYAVMEKADNVYTMPADIAWSDLGTWGSLHVEMIRDEQGNSINAGETLLYDTEGCLIRGHKEKLIVIKDLKNYIIVDEPDALMILPMHKEQEIKAIVGDVKDRFSNKFI